MKNLISVILILIVITNLKAQDNYLWESFTSYSAVNKICNNDGIIWAATNGGAFAFNTLDDSFITLNKSLGLSSHQITAVSIDNNGLIWLGDKLGVINVYNPEDGTVKKIIDIKTSDKTLKQINDITITGDTAFISTAFGLSLVNTVNMSFIETIVKFGDFTTETPVNSVFKDDVIYVCTEKGIAKQKQGFANLSAPDAWENINLNDELKINKIVKFNNELYAATERGIIKKDINWRIVLFSNYNVIDLNIFEDQLYAVLNNSIHKVENNKSEQIYSNTGLDINSLVKFNNNLYFSSNNGLYKLLEDKIENILPNSPFSNTFANLSIDDKSNVWVGTGKNGRGRGVAMYNGSEWTNYSRTIYTELPTDDYLNVHASDNGKIYFISFGFGFTELNDNSFSNYNAENSGMSGVPWANNFLVISDLKTDSKQNSWVLNYLSGKSEVLSLMTNSGNWHHYKVGSPYTSQMLNTDRLIIDQYNNKWFTAVGKEDNGSKDKGLYRFNENGTYENTDDDTWLRLTSSDGLHSSEVTALALDTYGELWIGTVAGINYIIDPSSSDPIVREPSFTGKILFDGKYITAIAVDALNNKWIGTNEGIYYMNSDCSQKLAHYDSENSPLPVDQVLSLAIDDNSGKLYVGTDFGLTSLQTTAQKPVSEFDEIFTYPSPFIIGNGENNNMNISGLVKNSIVKIITVSGNLIRTLETPGGGIAHWDGRNEEGSLVSSGIYLLLAYDDGAENFTSHKIAVIRK